MTLKKLLVCLFALITSSGAGYSHLFGGGVLKIENPSIGWGVLWLLLAAFWGVLIVVMWINKTRKMGEK